MTLDTKVFTVTRADLVRYAAASGDHNPIHQDEDVARSVGLPGVITHGMYTMALAARAVAEWYPAAELVSLGGKFTAPVVVPAAPAEIWPVLADATVDIRDISQSVVDDLFTMTMIADTEASTLEFTQLQEALAPAGTQIGVEVRTQREEVFNFMYRL